MKMRQNIKKKKRLKFINIAPKHHFISVNWFNISVNWWIIYTNNKMKPRELFNSI